MMRYWDIPAAFTLGGFGRVCLINDFFCFGDDTPRSLLLNKVGNRNGDGELE